MLLLASMCGSCVLKLPWAPVQAASSDAILQADPEVAEDGQLLMHHSTPGCFCWSLWK